MPQAIMDPEQVRRFAEELKRFNTDLQNRMSALQARFAALGDTWQDQEHAKFSEEFRDTLKALKRFAEVSAQHTPYLLRKAQRIEEYLNQR
jgi:uncharacterized protein YukE